VRTYGQYCPVARTAEIFAERWTPIIIRNLLAGVTTFGQLLAGAPGIPKALLAERLAGLQRAGIVERRTGPGRRVTYGLTDAGRDLKPLCDAMGAWGMRWLEVEPQHVDPAYVLWATARLVDVEALPPGQVTVRVDLREAAGGPYWLLLHRPVAEVCTHYPGTSEDLILRTDADALARWHLRECSYARLVRQQRIRIDGLPGLVRAFPGWIRPSPHAVHRTPASAPPSP
jgi:DNA-binding HxlR family transcriptional regulator